MRLRIYLSFVLVALALPASVAGAEPPCSRDLCTQRLTASEQSQRWVVPGRAGGRWLLYLNLYTGGKRLVYEVLPGGCDASYSSTYVAAVLHACNQRSTLDFVSYQGERRVRVEYRYVRR